MYVPLSNAVILSFFGTTSFYFVFKVEDCSLRNIIELSASYKHYLCNVYKRYRWTNGKTGKWNGSQLHKAYPDKNYLHEVYRGDSI